MDDGTSDDRPLDDERAYCAMRSGWHERMAARSAGETEQALHRRFADLYAARARGEVAKD